MTAASVKIIEFPHVPSHGKCWNVGMLEGCWVMESVMSREWFHVTSHVSDFTWRHVMPRVDCLSRHKFQVLRGFNYQIHTDSYSNKPYETSRHLTWGRVAWWSLTSRPIPFHSITREGLREDTLKNKLSCFIQIPNLILYWLTIDW